MLVLSRLINETIIIGSNIRVTILDVQDDAVRIGISAPDHTPEYWEQTIRTVPVQNEEENETQEKELLPLDSMVSSPHVS